MIKDYSKFTNKQLFQEFHNVWKASGVAKSNIGIYLKNHNTSLFNEIVKRTIKLNQYANANAVNKAKRYISIFERIYCLEHGLDDRPMCKTCGKKHVAGFFGPRYKYGEYCSSYCQRRSSLCAQHGIETKKRKYGEDDYMHWKKARQTRIDRYGTYYPPYQTQKIKATKLSRYGDENYVNIEKILATVERHKKENPNYYYDREQKTKQTKIANGHDPNWNNRQKFKKTVSEFTDSQKQEIKEKRRSTCRECYGHDYPTQSEEVLRKMQQTNLQNYGVSCTLALQDTRISMQIALRQKAWDMLQCGNFDVAPVIDEQVFITNLGLDLKKDLLEWKCKKCGHEFKHTWSNWNRRCPKCHPQNFRGMQTQLEEYVRSICGQFEVRRDCKSVLKGARQLDIYIPQLSTAIEFNGCFWHNSDIQIYGKHPVPMSYHAKKTDECQQYGIRLLHIFEDDWISHERLCKSRLKKILCPSMVKHIDAANCSVVANDDELKRQRFLEKYTFYGNDGSSLQYCLVYKGHIVAMMTFSKTRNDTIHDWQVLNYAEVNFAMIDGGFYKLLDFFVRYHSPKSIVMRIPRDWYTSEDFIGAFDRSYVGKPRLFWTHDGVRIKGSSITQANASSILTQYDSSKSFIQNMNDNKYYRIYDSGTIVFEKSFL